MEALYVETEPWALQRGVRAFPSALKGLFDLLIYITVWQMLSSVEDLTIV